MPSRCSVRSMRLPRTVARVRGHYVRVFAVATSALRRAKNAAEFSSRVQAILGVPLRVLSGEEEAAAPIVGR